MPCRARNWVVIFCKGHSGANLVCWGTIIKQAERNKKSMNIQKDKFWLPILWFYSTTDDHIFAIWLSGISPVDWITLIIVSLYYNQISLINSQICFLLQRTTSIVLFSSCNFHLIIFTFFSQSFFFFFSFWPMPQLQQCQILNPLLWARDQTAAATETSQIINTVPLWKLQSLFSYFFLIFIFAF